MTYILIVALGVVASPMTSIPGFPDKPACESAGEAWKLEVSSKDNNSYGRPRYYCVPAQR